MDNNGRTLGTVQWFSRVKGYGFIKPDGDEEDVFVHFSSIRGEGYRNLHQGQRVEFTVEDTEKGPQAVDVVGVEGAEEETVGFDESEDSADSDDFEDETTSFTTEFDSEPVEQTESLF